MTASLWSRLCLAFFLALAGRAQDVIPGAVKAKLGTLLPDGRSEGVPKSGATQFYSSNLYQYMDGGADIYLTYGLVAMAHQEYQGGGIDMTVDVFDMGDPVKAFGIYAAQRAPTYHFIPIGTEGYSSELTLNFLEDRYYVRLSAFGDKGTVALEKFARSISQNIGSRKSLPAVLKVLPAQNRVPHSEQYLVKAPAGLNFLAPALMATYTFDGQETALYISLAPNAREAGLRVERLREHYARSGEVNPEPDLGPGAARTSDASQGGVIFFARGRYAVLCLHAPAEATKFLNTITTPFGDESGS